MVLDIRSLDDRIAVAPQINEADFAEIARKGYRTIINNRPDGEQPGQLTAARAAELAAGQGLAYVYVPVNAQTMGPAVWEAFDTAMAGNPGPVLAHCRSGTRSTHLWAYAEAGHDRYSLDEIVERAAAAGYDIQGLRPTLERIRASL
jgi:sulfide:quinone oxidoreductase